LILIPKWVVLLSANGASSRAVVVVTVGRRMRMRKKKKQVVRIDPGSLPTGEDAPPIPRR